MSGPPVPPQDDGIDEDVMYDADGKVLLKVRYHEPKHETLTFELSEMPPKPRQENRKARRARESRERRRS